MFNNVVGCVNDFEADRDALRLYALEWLTALRDESAISGARELRASPIRTQWLHHLACTRHADRLVIGATRQDELAREIVDGTREVLDAASCVVAVAPRGSFRASTR